MTRLKRVLYKSTDTNSLFDQWHCLWPTVHCRCRRRVAAAICSNIRFCLSSGHQLLVTCSTLKYRPTAGNGNCAENWTKRRSVLWPTSPQSQPLTATIFPAHIVQIKSGRYERFKRKPQKTCECSLEYIWIELLTFKTQLVANALLPPTTFSKLSEQRALTTRVSVLCFLPVCVCVCAGKRKNQKRKE